MSNSVISIIKGGLGNQLFIYAAGRAFALRNDRDFFIDCKRGFTHDNYGRSYRMHFFPIQAKIMPEEWRVAVDLKHPLHKVVRTWNKLLPRNWRTYLAQDWNQSTDQLIGCKPLRNRITLNGYWQDEAYFSDYSEFVFNELTPPAPQDERNLVLAKELAGDNTVFLHARRVRYPTLLPASYYEMALSGIRKKIADPKFVVFSDDIEWTRKNINFADNKVFWVDHNHENEIADLWLMTQCRHAIIANSSFSWWGAWLGGDSNKVRVIYSPDNPSWAMRPANGWMPIHCEC